MTSSAPSLTPHRRGTAAVTDDAAATRIASAPTASPARVIAEVTPAVLLVLAMVAGVNLAIPALQASSLHPSTSGTAWIVDSYTLVFACLLIPAGAIGDRFGRTRGMLVGLAVFMAGAILCALAPSTGVLMAGRALSGAGAALVLPATLAVSLARLPGPERAKAVALWSALTGVAGAVGNLGGGLAIAAGDWRLLFWAGALVAVGAGALIAARVPAQTPHQDPVDFPGAVLLTAALVGILYGVIDAPQLGWTSFGVIGSIVAGAALLGVFVAWELHSPTPMLDPRLFRLGGVRAGAVGIVVLFFALFGLFYLNAQYLQDVKGYSALITGICILPISVTMPVAAARSTRLIARLGARRTILVSLLVVAASLGGLSLATAATPYAAYGAMLAALGVGMGLALPPLSGTMVHALPPERAGVASGLNSSTRELGSAIGVAVVSTLLTSHYSAHLPAQLAAIPGARGEAVRHSVTAALLAAHSRPDASALVHATRDAFLGGTSLGLRVAAGLVLLTAALLTLTPTKETHA